MKRFLPLFLLTFSASLALVQAAGDAYPRAIFSDDFSADGFGKRWGHYKSSSVVKDGVLHGITDEKSDHPAVDNVVIDPEKDLQVSVKFQFLSDKAKGWNLWFDDKTYKGSHAGHICSVSVTPTSVNISDAKTGNFKNEYYEKRSPAPGQPSTLTEEEKAVIKTKNKVFPVKLSLMEWHTIVASTKGDTCEVAIDGKPVGAFQSEGIAHDTKTLVSLTTNRVDVDYDDFSIKGAAK
jgi:hypothetical protein